MSAALCTLKRGGKRNLFFDGRDAHSERVGLPNLMNFQKNSKRPLTHPPHFQKIIQQFFLMDTKAKQAKGSIRKLTLAQIMVLYLSQGYHSAMV